MDNERYERIDLDVSNYIYYLILCFFICGGSLLFANTILEGTKIQFYIVLILCIPYGMILIKVRKLIDRPKKYFIVILKDCGNIVAFHEGIRTPEIVLLVEALGEYLIISTNSIDRKIKIPFFINKAKIVFEINNILFFSALR
ncbi:MAG: hypothetical protein H7196_03320 [candidate division SR1 bacterium]|nr:hypothetical protein [candidate division SR1 bacterium]